MKNENFIIIRGWMIKELNLKGTELLVYAIIYSYSQDAGSEFKGSLAELAEWCNVDKSTAQRAVAKLVKAGLILKNDVQVAKNLKFVSYRATQNAYGIGKTPTGHRQNAVEGIGKTPTNNYINNKNKSNNTKRKRFAAFPQREYDFAELERKLRVN